mmetsp:Transcript_99622/g.253233  ORF Transcript_99622/g.253233 Transcript_99622/m.253233 type:complete len:127 (+) Transcript_99622:770-1150(+)
MPIGCRDAVVRTEGCIGEAAAATRASCELRAGGPPTLPITLVERPPIRRLLVAEGDRAAHEDVDVLEPTLLRPPLLATEVRAGRALAFAAPAPAHPPVPPLLGEPRAATGEAAGAAGEAGATSSID